MTERGRRYVADVVGVTASRLLGRHVGDDAGQQFGVGLHVKTNPKACGSAAFWSSVRRVLLLFLEQVVHLGEQPVETFAARRREG